MRFIWIWVVVGTMLGIVTRTERSLSDSQEAKDHLIINIGRTGLRSINEFKISKNVDKATIRLFADLSPFTFHLSIRKIKMEYEGEGDELSI